MGKIKVKCKGETSHYRVYDQVLDVPMRCEKCGAELINRHEWSEPDDTKSDKV